MMLVFLYINLRDLYDFMLVILMLLIKFIIISLRCKLYVRNESLDLQHIMINNNYVCNAIWICIDDGKNMRYV